MTGWLCGGWGLWYTSRVRVSMDVVLFLALLAGAYLWGNVRGRRAVQSRYRRMFTND